MGEKEEAEVMSEDYKVFTEAGQKLREVKDKRSERRSEEDNLPIDKPAMEKASEILQKNEELIKLYRENAGLGSKNLSGASSLLKIYTAGWSKAELGDGSKPNDGWFFHTASRKQYKTVNCYILTISCGFRRPKWNAKPGDKEEFSQIMAGVIVETEGLKPFIMYLKSKNLQPMWDFGKEVSIYTHADPVPVPLFAMAVQLSTEKVNDNQFKKDMWQVRFDLLKDETGFPKVVTDIKLFNFLKEATIAAEARINGMVVEKVSEEQAESVIDGSEDIKPSDMPF